MAQKLALLICATPNNNRIGPSVYVPFGEWLVDLSDLKDSEIGFEFQPIHSLTDNWSLFEIVDNKISEAFSANLIRVYFKKIGTEKEVTVTIQQLNNK